jgi:hypothetical protein
VLGCAGRGVLGAGMSPQFKLFMVVVAFMILFIWFLIAEDF